MSNAAAGLGREGVAWSRLSAAGPRSDRQTVNSGCEKTDTYRMPKNPPHPDETDRPAAEQAAVSIFPAAESSSRRERLNSLIGAFIFDVDGVIADTAELHHAAWRRLAQEEELQFDAALANQLRGLSRQDSLRRLLGSADVSEERFAELADRKNAYYQECLRDLTKDDVLPGVRPLLNGLAELDIKLAVVSLSCNARAVLLRIGVVDAFDIIIDGRDMIRVRSSLNRFQRAAGILGVEPGRCVVVEDSTAGIAAARAVGMRSVGVGDPDRLCAATLVFESLRGVQAESLVQWLAERGM